MYDNEHIYTASSENIVTRWSLELKKEHTYRVHDGVVRGLALHGDTLLTASYGIDLSIYLSFYLSIYECPSPHTISDGKARVLEASSGQIIHTFNHGKDLLSCDMVQHLGVFGDKHGYVFLLSDISQIE